MNFLLLLIPLLTAFTAWLVIHIFSRLIFFPVTPVNILGFTIQGILPSQQKKIAASLGSYAMQNFDPAEMLGKKLQEAINFEKFRPIIDDHLEDFLKNKLKEQIPMLSMLIGDKTIASVKSMFVKEVENLFPKLTGQLKEELSNAVDIKRLVEDKINAIPPEKIATAYQAGEKDLAKIKLLALLFGLLIGIVQLTIVWLSF